MPREAADQKARRYLTEGRLTVTRVEPFYRDRAPSATDRLRVEATCRGSGQVYRLGYDGAVWWCDCPALSRRCAHLLALQLVTTPEARGQA